MGQKNLLTPPTAILLALLALAVVGCTSDGSPADDVLPDPSDQKAISADADSPDPSAQKVASAGAESTEPPDQDSGAAAHDSTDPPAYDLPESYVAWPDSPNLEHCEESHYQDWLDVTVPWAEIASISSWIEADEERLLSDLEDGADVAATDGDGRTMLHWAAECNERAGVVELLLDRGADVNARTAEEETPLHLATSGTTALPVIELLLDRGADIKARDSDGATPLIRAGSAGNPEAIALLIDRGADVTTRSYWKRTVLHMVSDWLEIGLIKSIIELGADIHGRDYDGVTPFHRVAGKGDIRVVELMLDEGATVNIRTDLTDTPLHWAAAYNTNEVVKLLLDRGAKVDAEGEWDKTPIHWAAASNRDPAVIELLLERGADIEARSYDKETPLHLAAAHNTKAIVKVLLDRGADVLAEDRHGSMPLNAAAEANSDPEVIELLLERGADVSSSSDYGETALLDAVYSSNDPAVLKVLLEHGADTEAMEHHGGTALVRAGWSNDPELILLLLDYGADVTAKDESGFTVLHTTSRWFGPDLIERLIEHGADIDAMDDFGRTPLHHAAANKDIRVLELLIDKGADIHAAASQGVSPLHWASFSNSIDAANLLLDLGADVNAQGERDRTPLHYAVDNNHLEMAELLLERGALVNASNPYGYTPLHEAVNRQAEPDLLDLLLRHGADIEARTHWDWTPLHVATQDGNPPWIAGYLLDKGANIHARDHEGNTPLHLAADYNLEPNYGPEVMEVLLERGADRNARNTDGQTACQLAHVEYRDYPCNESETESPSSKSEQSSRASDRIVDTVNLGGYWSDGTANVEVTTSIPGTNSHEITVSCSRWKGPTSACPEDEVSWPKGESGTAVDTLTMRLPMGESYTLSFRYNSYVQSRDVFVPERILGVERDVWECFSDTSNYGTIWADRHGVGCGGWFTETITKWDHNVPVRAWANPEGDSYSNGVLREVLEELSPILNLQIQWVTEESDATFVAHLGVDESSARNIDIGCRGCIATRDEDDGVIHSYKFIDRRELPESQAKRNVLYHVLQALFPSLSRHLDQTSVLSNYSVVNQTRLHRMDRELFKLYYHPLIGFDMPIDQVRELVVLREELLDRPDPDPLTPLEMLEEAYVKLQAAGSAQYSVSVQSANCGGQLDRTPYRIANFGFYSPRWIQIDIGSARHYILEHGAETWRQESGQWRKYDLDLWGLDSTLRQFSHLSPHSTLRKVIERADDVEIQVGRRFDGDLSFVIKGDPTSNAEVVLDKGTYRVREYRTELASSAECGHRELSATDGQYGIDFEIPEAIWNESVSLSVCNPISLGSISEKYSVKSFLPGSCGSDPSRNRLLYSFSLDSPRSAVNILIDTLDVTLRLLADEESSDETVDVLGGDYPGDYWVSSVLPAGKYTIEIESFDTLVEEDFTLEIGVAPLAKSVAAVSSGAGFTCALNVDGVPFCWGINPNGQSAPPSGEKFMSISSGWAHTCALRADGSAVCWGNDFSGESSPGSWILTSIAAGWGHTCGITVSDAPLCWGEDELGQSTPPKGEKFTDITVGWGYSCALRVDGSPACWGTGTYEHGQSLPPANETFTSISSHSGGEHTCALRADGSASCWGNNEHGESTPPQSETFTAISSGNGHTCALRADGSAVCWGDDRYGQSSPPVGATFTAISSGHTHTCGIDRQGQVLCWGDNKHGAASPPD